MQGKLAIHGGPKAVPNTVTLQRWPVITSEDKQAVLDVLDRGVLCGAFGPEAVGLETEFAQFAGARHAMATGSGTSAIHCALYGIGVGPGDEVITSAFSFSGSFHPILQQNAIPVFVDINPRTYNIDAAQIEAKITDKTRALLPVHIHGLPADMDEIMALARKYDLSVVEDACQAHGATYKGRQAGTIGRAGCFSLNATKNLSGGEGGLVVTDDDELWERARQLRTFGEQLGPTPGRFRSYASFSVGYQYRTQELPAALARSQLRRLRQFNENAQRNGRLLSERLAGVPGLLPPLVPPDRETIYHKYRLRLQPEDLGIQVPASQFRDRLIDALEAEGVPVMLWHLDPLPAFPLFQSQEGWGKGCPWSCQYYGRSIEYRREDYPETQKLLDGSIVVGNEEYPLYPQSAEAVACWAEAIRKVVANPEELMS